MSSSLSAIGIAPIQPVPPIVFQPPEKGVTPVEASASADKNGSGEPDLRDRQAPQWPSEPLTYANPATAAAAEQPSDAIFEPETAVSWASAATGSEDIGAQGEDDRPRAPDRPSVPLDARPPLTAEGEAMFAQELLDQVLSNEALYPAATPVAAETGPDAGMPAPAAPQPSFATPAQAAEAEWRPDYLDAPGETETSHDAPMPATSDAAILAASDAGQPARVAANDSLPAETVEIAPRSTEKRSYDVFAQASIAGAGGAQAQAAAMAQAAYEMVARVADDSPAALDAVKLA